eukprot:TRINITY_DN57093_c0_g1_i1.p1 TRINITY_DN57093_c0_g1~~TRINITY_DN57093_c0_g1_i1.p1  ORF type:complete len:236 (-),score=27.96 TRINITY_DN57093_c0_g1_i1:143-850(-)
MLRSLVGSEMCIRDRAQEMREQIKAQATEAHSKARQKFKFKIWHALRLTYHAGFSMNLTAIQPILMSAVEGDIVLRCHKLVGSLPDRTLRTGYSSEIQDDLHSLWADGKGLPEQHCQNSWQVPAFAARTLATELREHVAGCWTRPNSTLARLIGLERTCSLVTGCLPRPISGQSGSRSGPQSTSRLPQRVIRSANVCQSSSHTSTATSASRSLRCGSTPGSVSYTHLTLPTKRIV